MNKEELSNKKSMREFNKMMADMRHDLNKEHHWDERAKSQDKHWKFQKFIWGLAAIIAIITALGAPVLTEYMKYIFHTQPVIEGKNQANGQAK